VIRFSAGTNGAGFAEHELQIPPLDQFEPLYSGN